MLVRTGATADNLMPVPDEIDRAVEEFRGLAEVIEVGNEPPQGATDETGRPLSRWDHAQRMEDIARNQAAHVHNAGMKLCTGGWTAQEPPPSGDDDLSVRLRTVYQNFDAIGLHMYDTGDLLAPATRARLDQWHACFPDKPIYITEYGIAYLWLLRDAGVPADDAHRAEHDAEKARRYSLFLDNIRSVDYVPAAFVFLLGGTTDWEKMPGDNGYWLADAAWGAFPGDVVRAIQLGALPLRGAPTIDPDKFAQVLQNNGSLVLGEAPAGTFYDLCTRYNVDPAVALAFFGLESHYGTQGDLGGLRNWGMLWDKKAQAVGQYPTWQAGLEDWLRRVQGPAYFNAGEPTIASVVPIYRPFGLKQFSGDQQQYIAAARGLIMSWQE